MHIGILTDVGKSVYLCTAVLHLIVGPTEVFLMREGNIIKATALS